MANLLVRGVDESLVQRLRERAASHGRSAEAEHRAILDTALRRPKKRNLTELLGSMPDVGQDSDFERPSEPADKETSRVFD